MSNPQGKWSINAWENVAKKKKKKCIFILRFNIKALSSL